jgi:hypothetical protein
MIRLADCTDTTQGLLRLFIYPLLLFLSFVITILVVLL